MLILSEGASISRPPLLDETNYPYWKMRMRAFIQTMDVMAWRFILTGWTPPTVTDSEGKKVLKPEVDWPNNDDCLVNYNEALHAIFNTCDFDHIKLISSCKTAKEA